MGSNQGPTEGPPQDGGTQGVAAQEAGSSRPKPLSDEQMAATSGTGAGAAGPSQSPPQAGSEKASSGADGVTAAIWRSGTVTALWSRNEVRNAWMHVANLGWRKLFNGRDGSFQALTFLASQAKQTGRTIQFREEADTMIHEIYLW